MPCTYTRACPPLLGSPGRNDAIAWSNGLSELLKLSKLDERTVLALKMAGHGAFRTKILAAFLVGATPHFLHVNKGIHVLVQRDLTAEVMRTETTPPPEAVESSCWCFKGPWFALMPDDRLLDDLISYVALVNNALNAAAV